jgi:pimeloyl-ACP methyl ester carboxylesterase
VRTRLAAAAALLALTACNDPAPRTAPTTAPPSSISTTPTTTNAPDALAQTIARYGAKKLRWTGCGEGFECAKLAVPLDYATPVGDDIELSVIRLKARGRDRIGSVVLNPGGPGGSGVEFARQAQALLPGEILDRFDVVSFDPRGVASSSPVDCFDDAQMDRLVHADPTPDSPAERRELFDVSKQFANACQERSARLLPHVGTLDAAKDMDVLRAALGDKKLTYVGFSYGTLLGARYAEQFPTHIRALVLDGALDPTLTNREISLAQAVGFEKALESFLADCERQGCAFASHGGAEKAFDELMRRVEAHPLDGDAGRELGPSEALFGVAAALYSPEFGWPVLRGALESAYSAGDGLGLMSLFDNLVERDHDGHFSNSIEAQSAVNCLDGEYAKDESAYDADAKAFAKKAPRFGEAIAYGPVVCAYWPVPPVTKPGPVHANGAPPIVVVGTTRDPATPYAWSVALAKQLPGTLVTYDGDGHTAYGYHRNACVERVVDAYLISLAVPKAGTRCG